MRRSPARTPGLNLQTLPIRQKFRPQGAYRFWLLLSPPLQWWGRKWIIAVRHGHALASPPQSLGNLNCSEQQSAFSSNCADRFVADTFDPYFEWLGIEGGRRPPDHYRLLGLKQFESDPELIARAADAALAKVRRVRPGAHLAEWSQLLDRISLTKACCWTRRVGRLTTRRLSKQSSASPKSAAPSRPSPQTTGGNRSSAQPISGLGTPRRRWLPIVRAGASPPPKPVEPAFGAPLVSEDLLAEFDAIEVQPMPIVTPSIPASSGMGPIIVGLVALAVVVARIIHLHDAPTTDVGRRADCPARGV